MFYSSTVGHRSHRARADKAVDMTEPVWDFADFEFSLGEGLRQEGRDINLQPKARQLLELLLRSEAGS